MSLRHIFRSLLIGAAALVCVFVILPLILTYSVSRGVENDFDGLSGNDAALRLGAEWPEDVRPREITSVSRKYAGTIDSHSTWFRIVLSPDAAETWQNEAHRRQEQGAREAQRRLHDVLEGVYRIHHGRPPLQRKTGKTPSWWVPPNIEFRATEAMIWYDNDSGGGRATYSGYDESTMTLWIHEYSRQHDQLWERGKVPAGEQFFVSGNSSTGTAEKIDAD